MKKSIKTLIISVVVLAAVLLCFAACNEPTPSGPVDYGFTLEGKTLTYDGNTYSLKVGENSTKLNGKTYTVAYSYKLNGQEVSKDGVKDAGAYEVSASVMVQGEETPIELKADLTINKMDVTVTIDDQIVRQGSSISSLPDPKLPADLKLGAGDKATDTQFAVSYEIKKGADVVTSLAGSSPTTKEEDALSISYKFTTTPKNYNFTFKTGKLYILSSADYTQAREIKNLIAGIPNQATFNTYTYDDMKTFISTYSDFVKEYPNLSSFQQKISGTCDVTTVETLIKTAEERTKTVFELDASEIDSAIGKVEFVAVTHTLNDTRDEDEDEGYISEFEGHRKSSRTSVEYKDVIAFVITIKNKDKYALESFFVGDKEFPLSNVTKTTENNDGTVTYEVGVANATAPANTNYGDNNKGVASNGLRISSQVLGALDGGTTLEVKLNVSNKYEIEVESENGTNLDHKNDLAGMFIKNFDLSSTRYTPYFTFETNGDLKKDTIVDGTKCRLTIEPLEGYVLKEVAIGNEIISGAAFEKNVYEFTISSKYSDDDNTILIVPTFVKQFTLTDVYITNENKEVENTLRDGIYTDSYGSGSITVSGGDVSYEEPIFDGEAEISITLRPATNYVVDYLTITGYVTKAADPGYEAKTIDVSMEDIENNKYVLSLEDAGFDAYYTAKNGGLKIQTAYKKIFNFAVTSHRNEVGVVNGKYNGEAFTTKYGDVTIFKLDENDYPVPTDSIKEGEKILVAIDAQEGYVPKALSINGKTPVKFEDEAVRYQMLSKDKLVYIYNTADNYADEGIGVDERTETNYFEVSTSQLNAGGTITIDVEYDAYYWLDFDMSIKPESNYTEATDKGCYKLSLKGEITDNGTKVTYSNSMAADSSGVIKAGNAYYIYYTEKTNRIYFTVEIASRTIGGTSQPGFKFTEIECRIGTETIVEDGTASINKSYKASIDEALGGDPETVTPGSEIVVYYDMIPIALTE